MRLLSVTAAKALRRIALTYHLHDFLDPVLVTEEASAQLTLEYQDVNSPKVMHDYDSQKKDESAGSGVTAVPGGFRYDLPEPAWSNLTDAERDRILCHNYAVQGYAVLRCLIEIFFDGLVPEPTNLAIQVVDFVPKRESSIHQLNNTQNVGSQDNFHAVLWIAVMGTGVLVFDLFQPQLNPTRLVFDARTYMSTHAKKELSMRPLADNYGRVTDSKVHLYPRTGARYGNEATLALDNRFRIIMHALNLEIDKHFYDPKHKPPVDEALKKSNPPEHNRQSAEALVEWYKTVVGSAIALAEGAADKIRIQAAFDYAKLNERKTAEYRAQVRDAGGRQPDFVFLL